MGFYFFVWVPHAKSMVFRGHIGSLHKSEETRPPLFFFTLKNWVKIEGPMSKNISTKYLPYANPVLTSIMLSPVLITIYL